MLNVSGLNKFYFQCKFHYILDQLELNSKSSSIAGPRRRNRGMMSHPPIDRLRINLTVPPADPLLRPT